MGLREQQTIRERFEDVLFLTERDEGMQGVYDMAKALGEKLTEDQLLDVMRAFGWEE